MSEGTIAVAMSGGLDSSLVAALLKGEGHSVVGLSMLLWDRSVEPKHGRCCGALDLNDARRVANQIGIPHYTLRLDEEFRRQVVDPFVDDYLLGRTPSPCVRCNTWIKFDTFLRQAGALGANRIATGHYARIIEGPEGYELHTANDVTKDQSYFLFELRQEQLQHTLFPLGELLKTRVRELARERSLLVADKAESMEVCFVDGSVGDFVEQQVALWPNRFKAASPPAAAEVVDRDGRRLGETAPYYRYTVGQRRGLGLASGRRLYVLSIDPSRNQLIAGDAVDLETGGLYGERTHWIGPPPESAIEATVKIRSRHAGVKARLMPDGRGGIEVEFAIPQRSVTPGQAAVFYEGTRVLGGCWISSAPAPRARREPRESGRGLSPCRC